MTAVRSDLLRVCNDQNVPLDDFKRAFCDRCLQPECTRSRSGASKFEQRVANWNEKLFVNPPRLDPNDPRYAQITGQRFLMIDPGPVPEVRTASASAWTDPRDLSDTTTVSTAQPKAVTTAEVPSFARPPATPPDSIEKKDLYRVAAINTPLPAPRMIGAAAKPEASVVPKADPWAGKETPLPSGEPTVAPGTKVRLGGRGKPGV